MRVGRLKMLRTPLAQLPISLSVATTVYRTVSAWPVISYMSVSLCTQLTNYVKLDNLGAC